MEKKIQAPLILTVLFFVLFVITDGNPEFLLEGKARLVFLHHFFHVSILHLVVNCYASFVLFGRKLSFMELIMAYLIASFSVLFTTTPTIGFSNTLYATMGLRTPRLSSSWWRSPNTIIFLIVTIGFLFVPKVSALTHIVSFLGGVLFSCAARCIQKLNGDYDKARGNR